MDDVAKDRLNAWKKRYIEGTWAVEKETAITAVFVTVLLVLVTFVSGVQIGLWAGRQQANRPAEERWQAPKTP